MAGGVDLPSPRDPDLADLGDPISVYCDVSLIGRQTRPVNHRATTNNEFVGQRRPPLLKGSDQHYGWRNFNDQLLHRTILAALAVSRCAKAGLEITSALRRWRELAT